MAAEASSARLDAETRPGTTGCSQHVPAGAAHPGRGAGTTPFRAGGPRCVGGLVEDPGWGGISWVGVIAVALMTVLAVGGWRRVRGFR